MSLVTPDRPMEQRLRVLRRAYADQLPHRIAQLERSLEDLDADNRRQTLRSLRLMAHSLAGSGAIFGFSQLSERARELADAVARVEPEPFAAPGEKARLARYVATLREAGSPGRDWEEEAEEDDGALEFEPSKSKRLLFLVTRNGALASNLAFQLGCFGYLVRTFRDFDEVEPRLGENPAALLLEADPFTTVLEQAEKLGKRFAQHASSPPMVLLSERSDLQSRLRAVRSRIEAFITSPPDIRRLVEQLELFTHTRSRDPYRVLVVNGSYDEGLRISLGLQQGGVNVELAVQPDEALKHLVDFQPELLLVDVELPEVTGPELAAVVRQSEAYLHLPIVFLCEGASLRSQLEIMRSGADDLITDPLDLEAMLGVVQLHAQRARSFRYFSTHDSLTGVLNHTEFMQRFEAQFEQASRQQQAFTYAHIDIDDLGVINDRHGYLTGDAVVKSLAGLLSQRLRRSDIIGRYGGEELGVVLPGTGVAAARRVLDEVRALFAELPHQVTGGSFFATFSCGVAGTPGYDVSVELHEAAKKASRLAYEKGGNRVLLPRG